MVDELLRFNGPVQHTIRTPLVDSVIRVGQDDIKISKGSLVLASLGAGNHDPSIFTNPHQLDFSRKNSNKHLAFAAGVHYCLGASLVKTFKNIEVVSQPEWRDRLTIRGVSKYELSVS
jgi:cytochrome P450